MANILDEIVDAKQTADDAEAELERLVKAARDTGYSWDRIGQALGMTRQGAFQKYRRVDAEH